MNQTPRASRFGAVSEWLETALLAFVAGVFAAVILGLCALALALAGEPSVSAASSDRGEQAIEHISDKAPRAK